MRSLVTENKTKGVILDYVNKVNIHRIKCLFSFSLLTFLMIIGLFILSNLPDIKRTVIYPLHQPATLAEMIGQYPIEFSTIILVCLFAIFSLFTLGFSLSLVNVGGLLYIFPLKIIGLIPVASSLVWTIIVHFEIHKVISYKTLEVKEWSLAVNKFLKNSAIIDLVAFLLVWLGVASEVIADAYWSQAEFIAFFMDFALVSWLMLSWMYFYVILAIKGLMQMNYFRHRTAISLGLVFGACITYLCISKKIRQHHLTDH